MSVSVTVKPWLTTAETLENTPSAPAGSRVVTHSYFDETLLLNGASTPTATKCAYATVALVAGSKTIDLTALTGTNGGAIDGTGLAVRAIRIKNTGSHTMTFAQGGSNPYTMLGNTYSFTLAQNQVALHYFGTGGPTVAAGCKNIAVTGTGTEEFELSVILG